MITALLASPEWDSPFFKILANNDTGAAIGHQGGAAIPKALRKYFPNLTGVTSQENPTTDYRIFADLYVEDQFLATVSTRYQFQTWGGTRTPEARLTDNLGPLRALASGEDILLIQRSLASLDHYRLILVRKTSAEYQVLRSRIGEARWGPLEAPPMTQVDFEAAKKIEVKKEMEPFQLFDSDAKKVETRGLRIARSVVFRETMKKLYSSTCSICGISLTVPDGPSDFEAAHIVPRSASGADDARNGLGLCRRHHWAFDKGLFGIDSTRQIYIPRQVRSIGANAELVALDRRVINESRQSQLKADSAALLWHMKNLVARFK